MGAAASAASEAGAIAIRGRDCSLSRTRERGPFPSVWNFLARRFWERCCNGSRTGVNSCRRHIGENGRMNRPSLSRAVVGAALILQMAALHAQERGADATTLDSVQVLGAPRALSDFPGAVSVVDGDTLR